MVVKKEKLIQKSKTPEVVNFKLLFLQKELKI